MELRSGLVTLARDLLQQIQQFEASKEIGIIDTNDDITPVACLLTIAQVYKLTLYLELYKVFPELLFEISQPILSINALPEILSKDERAELLIALAVNIISFVLCIPQTLRERQPRLRNEEKSPLVKSE